VSTSGAALLKRIRPRLKRVRIHLCLRADLLADYHKAETELARLMDEDAKDAPAKPRLGSGEFVYSDATQLQARKVQKLEEQIAESDTVFELEALPKDEWNSHVANYPPRKDNHYDMLAGYNRDEALEHAVRRCLIDPEFEDCVTLQPDHEEYGNTCDHTPDSLCEGGSWQGFVRVIASTEWEELKNGVSSVNTQGEDNPKSVLASQVLRSSGANSESPRSTASASAPSKAGLRNKSSNTKTRKATRSASAS
jgi:hypothetical protein